MASYRLTNRRMAAMILVSRIEAAMRDPITTEELQGLAAGFVDRPVQYTERTRIGVARQATKMITPVIERLDGVNDCDRHPPLVLRGERDDGVFYACTHPNAKDGDVCCGDCGQGPL